MTGDEGAPVAGMPYRLCPEIDTAVGGRVVIEPVEPSLSAEVADPLTGSRRIPLERLGDGREGIAGTHGGPRRHPHAVPSHTLPAGHAVPHPVGWHAPLLHSWPAGHETPAQLSLQGGVALGSHAWLSLHWAVAHGLVTHLEPSHRKPVGQGVLRHVSSTHVPALGPKLVQVSPCAQVTLWQGAWQPSVPLQTQTGRGTPSTWPSGPHSGVPVAGTRFFEQSPQIDSESVTQ